jgi:predicted transcriptional regulator
MPRKKAVVLTDHELRLMNVLWDRGECTVADVVDALPAPALAYSTVLTTMRTLEQKGYITHSERGRAFVYRPLTQRGQAARSAVGYLVNRFFENSPGALAMALLDDKHMTDAELARIEQAIAKLRKTSK